MTLYTFCQIKVIETRPCAVHLNYNMDKSVAIVCFFLFLFFYLCCCCFCLLLFVCFFIFIFCCFFFFFLCCCLFVLFFVGGFLGGKLKVYSNGINGKYVEVEQ